MPIKSRDPNNTRAVELGAAPTDHDHVEADITDLDHYTSTDWDTDFAAADLANIGAADLEDMDNVTITSIASGEILKWNGTAWVNNTLAEAGISATGHSHTESDVTDLDHYTSSDFDTDFAAKSTSDLSEGTNLYHTEERVEDVVGGMVAGNTETLITVTYQDADGTLDFVVDDDLSNYDNTTSDFVDSTHTHTESDITDLDHLTLEEVQDDMSTFLVGGTNITLTYDDGANSLTIDASGGGSSDHGALSGLGDDDHTQYLNSSRHDSEDHSTAMGTVVLEDISDVTETSITSGDVLRWNGSAWVNYADSNYADSSHTHTESDITDLSHYTSSDFDTDFGGKSTTDLSEGTNLYFTDERAQDAVGTILADSSEIDFTYADATPEITAALVSGSIDESKLDTSVNASLDLADSALQSGDNVSELTNDAGYITATLTEEQVEDYVGGMVTGNTETLITVTYEDGDGTLDFVVNDDLSQYDNTTSAFLTDITGEALSSLSDVTITTIASGELLKWNGSAWVNNTLAEAGIAATGHSHTESDITDLSHYTSSDFDTDFAAKVLDDLSDVTETTITTGDVLRWNGSAWVNYADSNFAAASHTHTESDITDLGSYLENVVEDTTPQLGGNLDVNGNSLVSTSNGDITLAPNGTGNVVLGNFTLDADQTVGAGQDDYVLTYDNASGLISLEAASGGGSSDHGALSGLGDDDHTQYLLADGSRDITGDITVDDDTHIQFGADGGEPGYIEHVSGLWGTSDLLKISSDGRLEIDVTDDISIQLDNTEIARYDDDVNVFHAASFNTRWGNYGGSWTTCGYYKDSNGFVHLEGLAKSDSGTTAPPQVIFTLPSDYRPSKAHIFIQQSNINSSNQARIDVQAGGNIRVNSPSPGANDWVSLAGISFYVGF